MGDPIDQGIDMLKRGFKFAKKMGGKVVKEGKKAAGIPTGKVSDANPRFYIVVARQGAMVREGIDLGSSQLHGLRRGDVVAVTQIIGRRARLSDPLEGWVSLHTADGEMILRPTRGHDKYAESEAMNRKFDRLRKEQMADGVHTGPIIQAMPSVHEEGCKEDFGYQDRAVEALNKIHLKSAVPQTEEEREVPQREDNLLGDGFFDESPAKKPDRGATVPKLAPTIPILKPPPRTQLSAAPVQEESAASRLMDFDFGGEQVGKKNVNEVDMLL